MAYQGPLHPEARMEVIARDAKGAPCGCFFVTARDCLRKSDHQLHGWYWSPSAARAIGRRLYPGAVSFIFATDKGLAGIGKGWEPDQGFLSLP